MCSRKNRKHRQKGSYYFTVYGRLLHDMAVSRFDRWPKLPKLTHLGVLLPCMSVKYLFTVTRWNLPKRFVKSFAESLDLYWFFDESNPDGGPGPQVRARQRLEPVCWRAPASVGHSQVCLLSSIYSGNDFVYTWLEALPLITQWLSCDTHIRSYIESEWIIWIQCYKLLKIGTSYWNIILEVLKYCGIDCEWIIWLQCY